LEEVLQRICCKFPHIEFERYIPKNPVTGEELPLDSTLGELGVDEITFFTEKGTLMASSPPKTDQPPIEWFMEEKKKKKKGFLKKALSVKVRNKKQKKADKERDKGAPLTPLPQEKVEQSRPVDSIKDQVKQTTQNEVSPKKEQKLTNTTQGSNLLDIKQPKEALQTHIKEKEDGPQQLSPKQRTAKDTNQSQPLKQQNSEKETNQPPKSQSKDKEAPQQPPKQSKEKEAPQLPPKQSKEKEAPQLPPKQGKEKEAPQLPPKQLSQDKGKEDQPSGKQAPKEPTQPEAKQTASQQPRKPVSVDQKKRTRHTPD